MSARVVAETTHCYHPQWVFFATPVFLLQWDPIGGKLNLIMEKFLWSKSVPIVLQPCHRVSFIALALRSCAIHCGLAPPSSMSTATAPPGTGKFGKFTWLPPTHQRLSLLATVEQLTIQPENICSIWMVGKLFVKLVRMCRFETIDEIQNYLFNLIKKLKLRSRKKNCQV